MDTISFSSDQVSKQILVVEDDYDIGDIVENYLKKNGFQVLRAINGQQAIEIHAQQHIDLVILDVKLPILNGWEVLNHIRQSKQTPVIMLTALDQEIDKVTALRIGADDFVVKPFNPNEIIARVEAVLRRSVISSQSKAQIITFKSIEINTETLSIYIIKENSKILLNLTLTEFKIITLMSQAPYKVFTRSELMSHCLPDGDALERTVDSHISKLRKKLEDHHQTNLLINVRGVGYRLGQNDEK